MVRAQSGSFHFAGRPIELLRDPKTFLARHGAKDFYLL